MKELKRTRKFKESADKDITSVIIQINIDNIRPNRAQPRVEFDTNSIIRLADSIRRYGILQPLTVRSCDESPYQYELVAGERRLRAAKLLGYSSVPCIIVEADERLSAELAIIENLLREDLNMFEEAYGFRRLIDNYSMTQEEVARRVSLSQSAVANKIRLLKLSYEEQRLIVELGLTERHARALLKICDRAIRIETIKAISEQGFNVARAEQYIEELLKIEPPGLHPVTAKKASKHEKDVYMVAFCEEKAANEAINFFNHRVEELKKSGRDARISVSDKEKEVEVLISICKS